MPEPTLPVDGIAPTLSLDLPGAVSIEFPANVKSHAKALAMIGGPDAISKSAEQTDIPLELRLRPDDPFEHPINSRVTKHQNLLLKIELPKRCYEEANGDIQHALKLAHNQYTAEPVRILQTNFRFREMSDFQRIQEGSPFVDKIQKSLFAGSLKDIKKLQLDGIKEHDPSVQELDIIPPPRYSQISHPFPYAYRQNPAVSVVSDSTGKSKLVNHSVSKKLHSILIGWNEPAPKEAPDSLEPPTDESLKRCITNLRALFDSRPLWTRRAIDANIDSESNQALKFALPHVAYFFKSGPYRGVYSKYGIDPRTSSDYAIYQSAHFRVASKSQKSSQSDALNSFSADWSMDIDSSNLSVSGGGGGGSGGSDSNAYIFDGNHYLNNTAVQLCDVTDPIIVPFIKQAKIRKEFDEQTDGWYYSEDLDKIRRLIRAKQMFLKEGRPITDSFVEDALLEKRVKQNGSRTSVIPAAERLIQRVASNNAAAGSEMRAILDDLRDRQVGEQAADEDDGADEDMNSEEDHGYSSMDDDFNSD